MHPWTSKSITLNSRTEKHLEAQLERRRRIQSTLWAVVISLGSWLNSNNTTDRTESLYKPAASQFIINPLNHGSSHNYTRQLKYMVQNMVPCSETAPAVMNFHPNINVLAHLTFWNWQKRQKNVHTFIIKLEEHKPFSFISFILHL